GVAGVIADARCADAGGVLGRYASLVTRPAVVHVRVRRDARRPAAVLLRRCAHELRQGAEIDAVVIDQAAAAREAREQGQGGSGREERGALHRPIPNSTTSPSDACGRTVVSPFNLKSCAPNEPSRPTRTGPSRMVAVAVGPAKKSPP